MIKYVVRKNERVILKGTCTSNFKTNKKVLDVARKALSGKLAKRSLVRVEVIRGDQKAGEWTVVAEGKKIA